MFRAALASFRAARHRTLALVQDLSQAELDWAPARGRWSAGEVLDHLLLAERFYRREIRQLIGLARAGLPPVLRRNSADLDISLAFLPRGLLPLLDVPLSVANWFVPGCVREFIVRARWVPARHPAVAGPRKGRSAVELWADLVASLEETVALFEANPDLDYRALLYLHPMLGRNNVLSLLRIVTLHEERHQGQLADLLRGLGHPRPAQCAEAATAGSSATLVRD